MVNAMYSLIVTTQGDRIEEFNRLLESLKLQTFSNFELIVVDQSTTTAIEVICNKYAYKVNHYRTGKKMSLSAARNIGLRLATGDYVAFPDDDCWYPADLLLQIDSCFSSHPEISCVCCCGYDPELGRPLSSRVSSNAVVNISEINALRYPMSIGIFAKFDKTIFFDEELGAGTKWGAGEESDYVLKLLDKGHKIMYFRDILVYHPYNNNSTTFQINKTYRYGQGYGALIKKAVKRGQKEVLVEYFIVLIRSLGGCVVNIVRLNPVWRNYHARIKGLVNGLISA